jgi:hypothetical protein
MCRVVVQGPGPGPRYGHVMALVGQRFLLSISGNDGKLIWIVVIWYVAVDKPLCYRDCQRDASCQTNVQGLSDP